MPGRSPVAKLAEAVAWLDAELERLSKEASERAGSILSLADSLIREMGNDVEVALEALRRDLERRVEDSILVVREEYRRRTEEELERIRSSAQARLDDAVRAVVEEFVKSLEGA